MLAQYDYDTGGAGVAGGVLLLIWLAVAVFSIFLAVRIASKAGYSGWWGVLALVPCVGVFVLIAFAFAKWPVQAELDDLRERYLSTPRGVYPPGQPPHGQIPPNAL